MEILDERGQPLRWGVGRLVLIAVALASFGVWVYAYSGRADRPAPDLLGDPGFAAAAEPRCAAARTELDRLEPAYRARDHLDRADTIDQANVILGAMVADLRQLPVADDRDRQIVEAWLGDWETFLEDRAGYAQRLRDDPGARFYQSDVANELLDRRLVRFASTNAMPSCGDPGDVG